MPRWRYRGSRWRVARSIETLGRSLEAIYPDRYPVDGTVGDLSHQARKSDHNPNDLGVVTAIDVGISTIAEGSRIVSALVDSRDPRIKYLIFNRRIWRSYRKPNLPAWTPAPYTGSNPHKSHLHLSVSARPEKYDDASAWDLSGLGEGGEQMLKRGDRGNAVRYFQEAVLARDPGALPEYGADSSFGEEMENAVKAYQADANLDPTGRIDGVTAFLLGRYHPEFDG